MQIKQFSGATIDEVLTQVRAELGEEAVILQTKRVVKGGVGGFFGREGVEVTAAEGMPPGEGETINREAASSVSAAPAPIAGDAGSQQQDDFVPTAFRRHLESRLAAAQEVEATTPPPPATTTPASPAAAYARAAAPFAAGDMERTQSILEAARAAVRDAHAQAVGAPASLDDELLTAPTNAPPAPARPGPAPVAAPVAAIRTEPVEPLAHFHPPAPDARPRPPADPEAAPIERPHPVALPVASSLEGARAELIHAGVDPRYLDPFLDGFSRSVMPFLAADTSVRDALKEHLAARLPTARDWRPWGTGYTIAFVGQSGVGKTSAAAGLAGRYRAAGLSVALVAAGAGPHDSLAAHARRLDAHLFRAPDGASLEEVCGTLADRDLVIIDTEGRSHQQLEEMEELAALLAPVKADEVHLVLPAATPLADLGDAQRRFRMVGVNRLTMTKLDETRFLGNLVNVPLRMGKPLGFLSNGTSIVDALSPADARRVAEMLLP